MQGVSSVIETNIFPKRDKTHNMPIPFESARTLVSRSPLNCPSHRPGGFGFAFAAAGPARPGGNAGAAETGTCCCCCCSLPGGASIVTLRVPVGTSTDKPDGVVDSEYPSSSSVGPRLLGVVVASAPACRRCPTLPPAQA